MEESFVSYEHAIKLKELGFDWECRGSYSEFESFKESAYPHNYNEASKYCLTISAPSLSVAQKWLREVKEIDVLVFNCACGYGWEISKAAPKSRGTLLVFYDDDGDDEASGMWLTYEKALSAGINRALKFIKNGE